MAKFRKNHGTGRGSGMSPQKIFKLVGLILIMAIGYFQKNFSANSKPNSNHNTPTTYSAPKVINAQGRNYLPTDAKSEIIHHQYYTIGYNEEYEVPNWVAYKLTEESLEMKNVPRAKRFMADDLAKHNSAQHKDYSHSGYTRGHMAPAGDMAFSKEAMQESFYMSNMTPQIREVNGGIWRELEENVRDWAYDNDELYVVSGSIFNTNNPKRIGKTTKVAVPDAFYKALLDIEGNKKKSIAFVIPHEKSTRHLKEYAISIDELETMTGLDFFDNLIEDNALESDLEKTFDMQRWRIDRKRFDQRVKHWNN